MESANGVAVSKDGKTLYVIETDGHRLLRRNVRRNGIVGQVRGQHDVVRDAGGGVQQLDALLRQVADVPGRILRPPATAEVSA